jgi:hypothetical protein
MTLHPTQGRSAIKRNVRRGARAFVGKGPAASNEQQKRA